MAILGAIQIEMKFIKLKFLVFALLTFWLSATNSFAVVVDSEEAGDYANFIMSMINTSQTIKGGATCVIGSDEIAKLIIAQDKNSVDLGLGGDQKKYDQCKAVYLSQGTEKTSRSEMDKFVKRKITTIAVFDGFIETGGMIQVQMGRRNFEIMLNSKEVKVAGVRLNALLLSLVIN